MKRYCSTESEDARTGLSMRLACRTWQRGKKFDATYFFALLLFGVYANSAVADKPKPNLVEQHVALKIRSEGTSRVEIDADKTSIDALGKTNYFQGLYPTDASMPQPKFPTFQIDPVSSDDSGLTVRKRFPLDAEFSGYLPQVTFSLEREGKRYPLYSGSSKSQITYRFGNLLRLLDASAPVSRSVEVVILDHRTLLLRVKTESARGYDLCADIQAVMQEATTKSDSGDVTRWTARNSKGWHSVTLLSESRNGEVVAALLYNFPTKRDLNDAYATTVPKLKEFDKVWDNLSSFHSLEPFLTGRETPEYRNLMAVYVNRLLRGIRTHGYISTPSLVESFGPIWSNVDQVFICFHPANRALLWIEPAVLANSLRTLLENQTDAGMVPQSVSMFGARHDASQIPNISSVLREYYLLTEDSEFLEYAYPRFKNWYQWFIEHRNPSGDGIFAVGSTSLGLWEAICEYKDNHTDPQKDDFMDTCNPLTRSVEVAGRPERVYLPDIIACQARMAEDLSFLASELGLSEDAKYFESEYRRVRHWANQFLWDEETKFYYPVLRATREKIMKKSNVAFWLMWAGIPDRQQADHLVKALFDPNQFFTTVPVPMIALNDPSFNPKCGHWGDGFSWPIDACHAFDGLLRYGYWDMAAKFATHYNAGVNGAINETCQPNEYYHHSGKPAGVAEFSSGACLPLFFQRYLRDYKQGDVQRKWSVFAPKVLGD